MEVSGTQNFSASPQAVWDALHNPAKLAAAGASNVQWADNAVTATINLPNAIPQVGGTRTVTADIVESSAPSHLKFTLNRSILSATGTVDVAPNGSGSTLTYNAVASLSGPLGAFEGMAKPMVQNQISQFLANFAQQV